MSNLRLSVPREFRRGGKADNEVESVASGQDLITLMCRNLGKATLAETDVLDMGCGTKLVQAILDRELPVRSYVGIDVHTPLIEFLKVNVIDDRFTFFPSDTHNEMYNPEGKPLSANTRLPAQEEGFDLICLFSVFTHLAPHDYVSMLQVLRRYIRPEGRIFFSLFVNELTDGGHGFVDSMRPYIEAAMLEKDAALTPPADFVDWVPGKPLLRAVYSRENALRLVRDTGWEVESLNDPEKSVQHYMICKPA